MATLVVLGGVLWASPAQATLVYELDRLLNGTTPPPGDAPWLTATFKNGVAGTVTLTLTANHLQSGTYLDAFAFNIDPRIVPSAVAVTLTSVPNGTTVTHSADNALTVPGFGGAKGWDFVVSFSNKNKDRFGGSRVAVFTLQGPPDLSEDSFHYKNSGDIERYVGAHILGYGSSAAITAHTPEPATLLAGALLLLPLGVKSRRLLGRRRPA